jgi:hypothetical protein
MTMGGWRNGRLGARLLNLAGFALLIAGALVGWGLPRLPGIVPSADFAASLASSSGADVSGYLGADITALAVIIAVIIGFNATALQIAGQAHSLGLVRGILRSLTPFLACWSITTGVALIYFLEPPAYTAQLWQMLCWFAAVVVLMVGYLWDLPWRLSGQYVGWWALRGLRGQPLATWESLEAFSVLQSAAASATTRGDIGTVRTITAEVGRFLVGVRDAAAEKQNIYDRRRYRALKDLLSGCAQNAAQGPVAVNYHFGRLQAGILLQATAVGHPMDDADHNLFSGLLAILRATPERYNSLWTGLRHGLCRGADGNAPFLQRFWHDRPGWASDDPRRVERVATALVSFHAGVWRELRGAWSRDHADAEASDMVIDLYRDLAAHLGKTMVQERHPSGSVRPQDLPLSLLDAVHARLLAQWPSDAAPELRIAVVNAYDQRRAELAAYGNPRR